MNEKFSGHGERRALCNRYRSLLRQQAEYTMGLHQARRGAAPDTARQVGPVPDGTSHVPGAVGDVKKPLPYRYDPVTETVEWIGDG